MLFAPKLITIVAFSVAAYLKPLLLFDQTRTGTNNNIATKE
jgi:hypothetical protein